MAEAGVVCLQQAKQPVIAQTAGMVCQCHNQALDQKRISSLTGMVHSDKDNTYDKQDVNHY